MKILALAVLVLTACGTKNVTEAPRWMTEKDQVRIEIIRTLIDAKDHARALNLIQVVRAEGVKRPELDLLQGIALRQQGMTAQAERLLVRAELNLPKSAEVQTALCVLHADDGHTEEAIAHCKKATELDDGDAAAWNNLGFLLLTTGTNAKAAEAALSRAIEIDGNNQRYRNNLGFAQVAAGEHRAALRTFMTTGTPADANYNVGAAFERNGEAALARTYYQRALKYDAEHSPADQALQRLAEDPGEEN